MPKIDAITPDSTLRSLRDNYAFAEESETHAFMAGLYRGSAISLIQKLRVRCRDLRLMGMNDNLTASFITGPLLDHLMVKLGLSQRQAFDLSLRKLERILATRTKILPKAKRKGPILTPKVKPTVALGGLTSTEIAVLSVIKSQPRGQGLSAKEIIAKLKARAISIVESTMRRHILPKLAKTHGVVNHRAAGGYLIP